MPEADRSDPRSRAMAVLRAGGKAANEDVREVKDALSGLAEGGDPRAQTLLGAIALEIDHDAEAARPWFERAAASGDAAARRSLGFLYATGKGVPADKDRAAQLYRDAAAGGDAFAMYNLASLSIGAGGRYASAEQTLALLRGAADAGIADAAAKLGDQLSNLDRDEEAVAAYRQAADRGHAGAMFALGSWARDGIVGAPDNVEAVRWFLAMMNVGNGNGLHPAHELAARMTDDQIREAAARAGRPEFADALITADGRTPSA